MTMRRERTLLFVLLFVSFAYFYQAGGWNQNSRFALVRAITNEGTLNIDPFRNATGDKAEFQGHFYSDKAPGIALAAVPVVAAVRPIYRAVGGDPESYPGLALLSYLSTVFTAGLFTALAGVCLFTLCLELGASYGGALFAALTYTFATPIWTLATIFIGHSFAAALLVFAFAAAMRIGGDDPTRDTGLGAMVGFGAGWATVSEFPAAIPAVLLALLAAWHARPLGRARAMRVLIAMSSSALICAAVLMIYQWACFGSPFHLAYSSEIGYAGMDKGLFGVQTPRLIRIRRILFGEYRGLLPLAPALALVPIAFVVMGVARLPAPAVRAGWAPSTDARSRRRVAAVWALIIGVYFILLNASYNYWEGGWSYGPRHSAPGIPFLCISLAFLWTVGPAAGRWLLTLLSAYGAAVTLIAVSTMPLPPANLRAPVRQLLLPAFLDGDLALNTQTMASFGVDTDFRAHHEPRAAFNLGMKMGLGTGHAGLIPLAIVWAWCGYALIYASGRRSARPAAAGASATASTSPPGAPRASP
jgi:hypothetical protein